LKRFGRRHHPTYRINAIDRRRAANGKVLEELGSYDPMNKDPEKQVSFNKERIEYWLSVGATPSDTVQNLLAKNGIDIKPVVQVSKPKKEAPKPEEPEAAAEPAAESAGEDA
jgi:small subunit ribosomal protein S16